MLVDTQWVADYGGQPNVRVVECDEDVLLYEQGHIPGSVKIDWVVDLNDPVTRDYVDSQRFSQLMRKHGISNDSTVVFYGDKNNWWACYALWVFKLFGHADCRIMDGGRARWIAEGRPLTREVPTYSAGQYSAPARADAPIRAFRDDVMAHLKAGGRLIDVRSPEEYRGERLHMPDYPNEGALRGGHIPGAANVPWARAVNEDSTFKSAADLRAIYETEAGLNSRDDVIAYCRIGERSSHTWFVLSNLLGYPTVRNYDGSWTEWGNLVRAPIEK
jgi:thiosulfate/3-mercaptopyruvate sulfurtransferase